MCIVTMLHVTWVADTNKLFPFNNAALLADAYASHVFHLP